MLNQALSFRNWTLERPKKPLSYVTDHSDFVLTSSLSCVLVTKQPVAARDCKRLLRKRKRAKMWFGTLQDLNDWFRDFRKKEISFKHFQCLFRDIKLNFNFISILKRCLWSVISNSNKSTPQKTFLKRTSESAVTLTRWSRYFQFIFWNENYIWNWYPEALIIVFDPLVISGSLNHVNTSSRIRKQRTPEETWRQNAFTTFLLHLRAFCSHKSEPGNGTDHLLDSFQLICVRFLFNLVSRKKKWKCTRN